MVRTRDVRLRGFADRVSVEQATQWIDAHARCLPVEAVELDGALGRVLAVPVEAPRDLPPERRAIENGYAVRAAATAGASDYDPLFVPLEDATGSVGAVAIPVVSGTAMPRDADAVLPFEAALPAGAGLQVFGSVAPGRAVEQKGQQAAAGSLLVQRGRRLRTQDVGLLATAGIGRVDVVRLPRIGLIVAGPKPPASRHDANGSMLRDLVRRDGGIVGPVVSEATTRAAMVGAMAGMNVDAVFLVGRTGTGSDDEAPLALAEAGELALHGIAMRPGGSAGMGLVGSVPVILLPGDPLACLMAYEMLGGRLVRRLAGRSPSLPHAMREAEMGRKIVSAVGFVDLCQVSFTGERLEPTGSVESGGLASAVRADGFLVVPARREGYGPGARVAVHLYGDGHPTEFEPQEGLI